MGDAVSKVGERVWRVPRKANAFEEAKRFTELALLSHDNVCREATVMAVWELAENVIKYGDPNRESEAGTIGIGIGKDLVRIRAKSVAASFRDARSAMETITQIGSAPSVGDLYRDRLRELFDDPDQPQTRLGLLRVAFEGGFRLSCAYKPPYFEIVAERPCTART